MKKTYNELLMKKNIPPDIVLQIQNRAANGNSYRSIGDWLLKEHGIKYSHVSIAKCVKQGREMRTDFAKEIVKPYLEKTLTKDLEEIDIQIAAAKAIIEQSRIDKEPRLELAAQDRLIKWLDLKRKFSGIDAPEEKNDHIEINYIEMEKKFAALKKDNNNE